MKKIDYFLVMCFMVFFMSVNGQEKKDKDENINTLFGKDDRKFTLGGFGGPKFGITLVNGNWRFFSGAKGGFLINRKYIIGIEGEYNSFFKKEEQFHSSRGGLLLEYVPNITKSLHLSYAITLGGNTLYKNKEDKKKREYDGYLYVKPNISVNFNFAKFFIGSIDISYTYTLNNTLDKTSYSVVSADDLSGINLGFTLKFGKF